MKKKMQNGKKKVCAPLIVVILTFSVVLASMSVARAAGAITLTPTTQNPGGSVTVFGYGFGALKRVGSS